jgi:hypothetical protein
MGPVRYAKLESGWASTPWLEGAKEDFCASIYSDLNPIDPGYIFGQPGKSGKLAIVSGLTIHPGKNPDPPDGFTYCHYHTTTNIGLNKDEPYAPLKYHASTINGEPSHQNFEYARAAAQKMSTLLFQSFWDKYSNCLSHSTLIRAGSGAQTGCRKPLATWAGTWSTSIGGFALRVLYPSTSRSPRKKHTQPSCTTSSDARDRSTTAAVTSIPATRARSWAVARRRIYLAGGGVTRMETQARSTSRSARRIRRSSQVGRNLTARRQRTRGQAPGFAISTGTAPDHHVSTHRRHPAVKARSVSENVADRLYGQALSRREDRDGQAVCLDDCAPTCLRSTGGCG